MVNLATRDNNSEIEFDIQFGKEPLGLAHLVQDKAMIATGTIVATWLGWILGGPILGGIALYMGVNDLKLKQPKKADKKPWFSLDEDEEFEGETVDTQAKEVDSSPAKQSDNWVDEAMSQGSYSLPRPSTQSWPPPMAEVNRQLDERAYSEAKDIVADGPEALLELLGDSAPGWVRAACEPAPVHTPESLSSQGVSAVRSDSSGISSEAGSFEVRSTGSDTQLNQILVNAPYVVPVIGVKGNCFFHVKIAIASNKSQTWISENMFGAKRGDNRLYRESVKYIQWVKEQ